VDYHLAAIYRVRRKRIAGNACDLAITKEPNKMIPVALELRLSSDEIV